MGLLSFTCSKSVQVTVGTDVGAVEFRSLGESRAGGQTRPYAVGSRTPAEAALICPVWNLRATCGPGNRSDSHIGWPHLHLSYYLETLFRNSLQQKGPVAPISGGKTDFRGWCWPGLLAAGPAFLPAVPLSVPCPVTFLPLTSRGHDKHNPLCMRG